MNRGLSVIVIENGDEGGWSRLESLRGPHDISVPRATNFTWNNRLNATPHYMTIDYQPFGRISISGGLSGVGLRSSSFRQILPAPAHQSPRPVTVTFQAPLTRP